jgi:hypothetical protein
MHRKTREDQFAAVWKAVDSDFSDAIESRNINDAHRIWCNAAETFLWRLDTSHFSIPTHLPRRGMVMPRVLQPIANRINKDTGVARDHFTKCLAELTGGLQDIRARLQRLQGLHSSATHDKFQREAISEQLLTIRQNSDGNSIEGSLKPPSDYDKKVLPITLERARADMKKVWQHSASKDYERGDEEPDGTTHSEARCDAPPASWSILQQTVVDEQDKFTSGTTSK